MEQCNYVDPARAEKGIQYDYDMFSHTIYENSLCIQTDDEKTKTNQEELKQSGSLPIYCIIAHSEINTNINVSMDDKFKYHIRTPASTFFRLENQQYAYDISPIGGLMECNNNLKQYMEYIAKNHPTYMKVLFSPNYKECSTPLVSEGFNLDSVLFSPPLYSTINKSLNFMSTRERSTIRFGIVQLNKPMDEEVKNVINSVGKISHATNEEEQKARMFNMSISQFGKLTNNPEAEKVFVEHLKTNNYNCTLEKLTSIFGKGIYIIATCSPLVLTINVEGKDPVKYNSEMAITSKSKKKPANIELVDKALYAFNADLQHMVYALNYRWMEMVQYNPSVQLKDTIPSADVKPSKKYFKIAETRKELNLDSGDETDGGVKKKLRHTTKKRKQPTKKRKNSKKRTTIKRHRRPSRAHRS
uniref:Uncharacterized protein n=1 Tax=viral metagenome TaxID=1070528 RepID=A0A6C0BWH6_9ZZZZ